MKLSVIIPIYNVASWLRECLDSVLYSKACEENSLEVICVDDGSTDGSGEILDEYRECDKRIKVIHQKNSGVSTARNTALEIAGGDWIMFVDGDDVVRTGWLEEIRRAITEYPEADAIHFEHMQFNDGNEINWPKNEKREFISYVYRDVVPDVFLRGEFCCKVYSRKLIGSIRFRNRIRGEDSVFLVECMDRAQTIVAITGVIYGYRQRSGSQMHSNLTASNLQSSGLCLFDQCQIWRKSKRKYSRSMWRKLSLFLTEFYSERFFGCEREIQNVVWPNWRDALLEIKTCQQFPVYNRVVLKVFAIFPYRITARILFYVPQWLKRKGIHR